MEKKEIYFLDKRFLQLGMSFKNKVILLICLLVFMVNNCFGQNVTVADAVSGNGSYVTLNAAFAAINGGVQTGSTIIVTVIADTNEGTNSATLNAGTWTSLIVKPSGVRTILGNTTGGSALINLNGADNVNINGLNDGSNSLTISNTRISGSAGTSTIMFIGDASNNIIQNCTIKGSSTGVAYGTSRTTANILFDTGTSTGNDNNQLLNCDITANGVAYPSQLIASYGTAAKGNNNITISGNTLHDYFTTAGMAAVNVGANSASWIITNNKIYQTVTQTTLTSAKYSKAIVINTAAGGGYLISGNIIGYNSATGTSVMTNSGGRFTGIELKAVAASPISSIQGNVINGINWTTASGASTLGAAIFNGIYVGSGGVDIGTITGNIIGATSGVGTTTNGIYFTSTINGSGIYPIYLNSTSACSIANNTIGAISTGGTAAIGYAFTGISVAGSGGHTITSNTIGNSTSGSISLGIVGTSTVASIVKGIENSATGANIIGSLGSGNIIQNIAINAVATNGFTGVTATGVGIILNINYNTIKGIVFGATTATHASTFTGISSTGAVTSTVNVNNNSLGTATSNLVNYNLLGSAASGIVTGITITGSTGATTHSIQNNDFNGIVYAFAGSGAHTYINHTAGIAANNTSTISGNTFTNLNVNTSGNVTFISSNYAVAATGSQTVNNNSIITGFNKASAGGTVKIFNTAAVSMAGATITNINNNFSNITVPGTTILTGWSNLDTGNTNKNINGNTFSNWAGGTGAIIGMTVNGFGTGSSVSNNVIFNITGQGAITGLNIGSAGNAVTLPIANTIVTGLSSIGAGGNVSGVVSANNATTVNINSNIINNLYSTGASSTISGIQVNGGTGATNVYSNVVNTISGTGSATPVANGITVSAGTSVNLYKNKIYDVSENGINSGATINGISLTGGTSVTAYNNIIGDLRAPATNSSLTVKGINVNSATASSTYKLYYNTVFLNASSTGTNFGTAGIYHTTSGTSTTANLIMNNNIIDNQSQANGAGKTAAYRRSSTTLTNYDATSNNNLFYVGIPSVSSLIFYDGTNSDQTLATYKTRVSTRETNSKTGNPIFLSTTGSNAAFLHIDPTDFTGIESGGVSIVGYSVDYDNDTRNVTTPDIGADEGTFTKPIITSLATTSACEGTSFVISGTNMQYVSASAIGGTSAILTSQTATTGTVTVGSGTTGIVTVTSSGGTAASAQTFTVYPTTVGGAAMGDQTICTGTSPSNITLSGNIGTVTKWQKSSDSAFTSPIDIVNATTTLTGAEIGNLTATTFFRAVVQSGSCSSANSGYATISIISTTWNGSVWSNGLPTSTSQAIIAGDYDMASHPEITACSLIVSSGTLTIADTKFITIENDLTVNAGALLNIANQGSLVMLNDGGIVTNNGTINVNKTTTPFEKYDYTYWSSPMASSDIATAFPTWSNPYKFVPANFEDTNGDGFDDNGDDWLPANTMTPARGYIVMGPTDGVFPKSASVVFTGQVNNGVVTTPIALTPNVATDDDWNLVGNPYPGAIDANSFINTNIAAISGTLYFWTHKNAISVTNPGPDSSNFSQDDYAMYNLTGGIATSGTTGTGSDSGSAIPTGYISSCQGFFVEADAASTLTFNNAMRVGLPSSANSQFFKTTANKKEVAVNDRVWLSMQNTDGMYSQQLVGYLNNSTLGYDKGYDGFVNDGGNYISFYSFIDNAAYRIQSRGVFNENDQVRLGYFSAVAGDFRITVDTKEGIFSNSAVYLEDKMLNAVYDLAQGTYSFTTESGTFDDRFVLRYVNNTLVTRTILQQECKVLVSNKGNKIKINSFGEKIDKVLIYDLSGRNIFQKSKVNGEELAFLDLASRQQTLIVKTVLQNGQIVTKKIIYDGH